MVKRRNCIPTNNGYVPVRYVKSPNDISIGDLWGYSQNIQSLDHDSVLKPMVTWGFPMPTLKTSVGGGLAYIYIMDIYIYHNFSCPATGPCHPTRKSMALTQGKELYRCTYSEEKRLSL